MARGVEARAPTRWHIDALVASLRPADAAELEVLELRPHQALEDALAVSTHATTLLADGHVVAMAGLLPTTPGSLLHPSRAEVWLLTSTHTSSCPWHFLRRAQAWLEEAHAHAEELHQSIDARHGTALGFARLLGFELLGARPRGPRRAPFIHAVRRKR